MIFCTTTNHPKIQSKRRRPITIVLLFRTLSNSRQPRSKMMQSLDYSNLSMLTLSMHLWKGDCQHLRCRTELPKCFNLCSSCPHHWDVLFYRVPFGNATWCYPLLWGRITLEWFRLASTPGKHPTFTTCSSNPSFLSTVEHISSAPLESQGNWICNCSRRYLLSV